MVGVDGTGTGSSYSREGGGGENARARSPLCRGVDDEGKLLREERDPFEREGGMVVENVSELMGMPPSLARRAPRDDRRESDGSAVAGVVSSKEVARVDDSLGRGPVGSPLAKEGYDSASFLGAGTVGGGM